MTDTGQALSPAAGGHVDVDGVKLYYEEYGQGYPLVCLHGGGPGANSRTNFSSNVGALSERYRTILLDMPQFGKSDKPVIDKEPLTFYAHHIKGFLDELGVDSANFIGNSMGGQATVKLAIDHPGAVNRMVLIGSVPVAKALFAPMPVEGVKLIAGYYKGEGPTREKMRTILATFAYDSSFVTDELVELRYQESVAEDLLELKRHPAPPRQDLSAELHKVACPALIVWGLEDRAGALDVGLQLMRAFQQPEMHIFSATGHWAQVERKDEFNRLVLEFFDRDQRA